MADHGHAKWCKVVTLDGPRNPDGKERPPLQTVRLTWCFLVLIVLITAGLRIRLLNTPLERDEGEYAYIAQLILQGEVPFSQAYTMKYPGVPYVYALFLAVFGQTDSAIHLGLLIINAASIVLVFLLGRRLFNPLVGLIACGSFALLSLSRSTFGFTANTEHFVNLPMLAATLLLLGVHEGQRRASLLCSGLLFGVSILMKQHAAVFAGFGFVYLLVQNLSGQDRSLRRLILHLVFFSAAVVFPVALLWLYLWMEGAFAPFWFWTFTYPRYYVSMVSFETGTNYLMRYGGAQVSTSFGSYTLALVGVIAALWSRSARPRALFLILFSCFSFLGVCPGFVFRPHYFLVLVPAVSLLAGVGAAALGQLCRRFASPPLLAALIALIVLFVDAGKQFSYLFQQSPEEIVHQTYSGHFNDMKELAPYIRDHSLPDDRIAVLGSEPEIYFYARRRAATKFIYVYPLMEPQPFALQMQEDMIAEMEQGQPRYIVLIRSNESWLSSWDSNAPQLISQWPSKYVAAHYQRVALVEMLASNHTNYYWGKEATFHNPSSDFFVVLYERVAGP